MIRNISTNTVERTKCLQYSGMEMPNGNGGYYNLDFPPYLKELGESYFVLSPNGNGVDCHKHWESLYLRTIPIVTKSRNMEFYKDLPFLVIDRSSFSLGCISFPNAANPITLYSPSLTAKPK